MTFTGIEQSSGFDSLFQMATGTLLKSRGLKCRGDNPVYITVFKQLCA